MWSDRIAASPEEAHAFHHKLPGFRFDGSGRSFQSESVKRCSDKSFSRKFASAMIAKIPLALARYIGRVYANAK